MSPIELANEAQKILDNKKALDIKVLKVEDVSILSDYMVIATGTSSTHVNALVVHIFSNEARSFYNLERLWENL